MGLVSTFFLAASLATLTLYFRRHSVDESRLADVGSDAEFRRVVEDG